MVNELPEAPTKRRLYLPPKYLTYVIWLIWIIWLPNLLPPILALLHFHTLTVGIVLEIAGVALFVALYLWVNLRTARAFALAASPAFTTFTPEPELTPFQAWWPIVVMTALSLLFVRFAGLEWGTLFIYTGVCAASRLPAAQAVCAILGLEAIIGVSYLINGGDGSYYGQGILIVGIASFTTMSLRWAAMSGLRLRAAHKEIARLAVMAERLRIARDLHDLLGHNLSVIALKSELAHRLIEAAPDRAAQEIGEIETVARSALSEVREVVNEYRQPTLTGELRNAETTLRAAGITYRFVGAEAEEEQFPSAVATALAWAIREGVTNIIRHSHAHVCRLSLTQDAKDVRLAIINDGVDVAEANSADSGGNGLRGLRERVERLGGCVEANRSGAEFWLEVKIPLAVGVQR